MKTIRPPFDSATGSAVLTVSHIARVKIDLFPEYIRHLPAEKRAIWRIVGAVIATYGGQALHLYAPGEPAGFFGSVLGAVVLLVLVRLFGR